MFVNGPSSDSYGLSAVAAPRAAGCHGHSPPSSQPTRADMGSGGGDLASSVLAVLQGLGLNVSPLTGANTPATATQATTATTAEPASTTTTAPSAPAEPAASGDMLKGDLRSFLHALIDALQNGGATAPAAAVSTATPTATAPSATAATTPVMPTVTTTPVSTVPPVVTTAPPASTATATTPAASSAVTPVAGSLTPAPAPAPAPAQPSLATNLAALVSLLNGGTAPQDLQDAFKKLLTDLSSAASSAGSNGQQIALDTGLTHHLHGLLQLLQVLAQALHPDTGAPASPATPASPTGTATAITRSSSTTAAATASNTATPTTTGNLKSDLRQFVHALVQALQTGAQGAVAGIATTEAAGTALAANSAGAPIASSTATTGQTATNPSSSPTASPSGGTGNFATTLAALVSSLNGGTAPPKLQDAFAKLQADLQSGGTSDRTRDHGHHGHEGHGHELQSLEQALQGLGLQLTPPAGTAANTPPSAATPAAAATAPPASPAAQTPNPTAASTPAATVPIEPIQTAPTSTAALASATAAPSDHQVRHDLRRFDRALMQALRGAGSAGGAVVTTGGSSGFAVRLASLISQVSGGNAPQGLQDAFSKLTTDLQAAPAAATVGTASSSASPTLLGFLTQLNNTVGYGKSGQQAAGSLLNTTA